MVPGKNIGNSCFISTVFTSTVNCDMPI